MKKSIPRVFIGSSTLGSDIAEMVKSELAGVAECFVWTDKRVFEINDNFLETLLQSLGFFDFGIFVATADDITKFKGADVFEPRDNVILEMGLYLGALGRKRAFLIAEDVAKLPSDFLGITMPFFNRTDMSTLKDSCNKVSHLIEEHHNLGYLSLLPSTALAVGYFHNFIVPVTEGLAATGTKEINGVAYKQFKFKVVMPKDLDKDIKKRADIFYQRNGLVAEQINHKLRQFPLWFQADVSDPTKLLGYDMPSTLLGVDKSIEMFMKKGYIGKTKIQTIIEQRELSNFKQVLQHLIEGDSYAREMVEVIDEF